MEAKACTKCIFTSLISNQSELETGLFYFFPFLVRKGSWLFHLTLVMDHGELRMSFHVSIIQQYLCSWSLFYHTILPHSMTSFLFDFIPLKPQANACNIVGQQLPTLLDFTVCICLHTLLQVVACYCAKFETSQTFKPTTPQHSYLFRDRWSIAQQCWIRLHSLSNIVGDTHVHDTWSPKSYGLYSSHDALQLPTLLGVVASICTVLGAVASVCT